MKLFSTVVLLFAGLASVQAQNNTEPASNNATATSSSVESSSATSTTSSARGTATLSFQDLINANLGGNINFGGGFNFGNFNFNNRNDVVNAIGLLMNQLCVGNFFNGNFISGLGGNQQLQLLFQLDQLNQLNHLGLINSFDLQGIFNRGFGGFGRGAAGFNKGVINFAGFRRGVDLAMAKLETNLERRNVNLVKRQQLCNFAGIVTATAASGDRRTRQTQTASASTSSSETSSSAAEATATATEEAQEEE